MDRTIGKSQKRNYDGERPVKILESYSAMATSLLIEADDDRFVSIGYGRYKLKGKEEDDDADVYTKTDSGQFVKSTNQKSDDSGKEKPSGGSGMGPDDFERDFDDSDDEPDYGDTRNAQHFSAEPEDKPHGGDTGTDADFQGEPPEGSREPDDVDDVDIKSDVESVKKEIENAPPEVKSWYEKSIGSKVDKALTYAEDVADWWENSDYGEDNTFPKWGETKTRSSYPESIEINGKKYRPIGDN